MKETTINIRRKKKIDRRQACYFEEMLRTNMTENSSWSDKKRKQQLKGEEAEVAVGRRRDRSGS